MKFVLKVSTIGLALVCVACGTQEPNQTDASGDRAESASLDQLEDEPVIDETGELRAEYAGVLSSIGEYDPPAMESVDDLVEHADAVAVGRSGDRSQFYDGDPSDGFVYTSQEFDLVETIKGDVSDPFYVSIVGGALLERDSEIYLLESDRNPQFEPDRDYLLFLRTQPEEAYGDHWWTVGPWLGRYGVEDGVVSRLFDDDVLGGDGRDDAAPTGHDDESASDELEMLGKSIQEIRDIVEAESVSN